MTDLIPPNSTPPQLYSLWQVTGAAIIGGPIAGGWLLRQNFIAVGESELGTKALILSALFTVAMFAVISALPTDTSNSIGAVPASVAFWVVYKQLFSKRYDEELASGGSKHSFWRTALVSIVAIPVSLAIGLLTMYLLPITPINQVASGQNTIYYEQNATKTDANALLGALTQLEVIDDESYWLITVSIPKNLPDRVIVSFTVEEAPIEGSEVYMAFEEVRANLASGIYADKDEVWVVFVNWFDSPIGQISGDK